MAERYEFARALSRQDACNLGAGQHVALGYKGGPVSADTLFYLHRLKDLEGAIELSNGLYLNGDFEAVKNYIRSEEHTSELQSRENLVCRLLLEKKKECL